MKHEFTLILAGISELTPDVTDGLYEAGFDDSLVGMSDGHTSTFIIESPIR